MRKVDLVFCSDAVAVADAPGCTGEITESVDRNRDSFCERRNQERRTQMGEMMFDFVYVGAQALAGKNAGKFLGRADALAVAGAAGFLLALRLAVEL